MRTGENYCPGILHAVPAKDGLLMRIRVPGGLISANQLNTVAYLSTDFADGQIEITSRANLQLRAIEARSLPAIVDALSAVDLLPSRKHDRVRNIATSPLTGLVPEETIDTRSLVRELDRRLIAEECFVELHPKFSFGIYGGGTLLSQEQDDLSLRAHDHSGLFQIFIGRLDTGHSVSCDQAVDFLLDAARLCITLAQQNGFPVRGRNFACVPGLIETMIEAFSPLLLRSPGYEGPAANTLAPIGLHPAMDASKINIFPVVALGRLTSKQGELVAQLATEQSGDLRLAHWRGIVLGAVALEQVADTVARLEAVGLNLDSRDGFHGMAACAGTTGCDASLADVRGDAQRIALRIAGQSRLPNWTINLSGCEKQCAMRHGAMAELVGTASGYLLRLNGQRVPQPCLPEEAIDLVVAAHNSFSLRGRPCMNYVKDGAAIYKESFAIIRREADLSAFSDDLSRVVVRMIHACGMTDLPHLVLASPDAAIAGTQALFAGAPILCDAHMVANGITRSRLPHDNEVVCTLRDERTTKLAAELQTTRSAAALELWRDQLAGSVVVIGNAPTALFHLLEMLDRGAARPALILGMPVGFVGAAESKQALVESSLAIPYITVQGRRGGSAIAAAAVNALASENE